VRHHTCSCPPRSPPLITNFAFLYWRPPSFSSLVRYMMIVSDAEALMILVMMVMVTVTVMLMLMVMVMVWW